MTTYQIPEVQLKQPSLYLYLWVIGKPHPEGVAYLPFSPEEIPFGIRARIVNTYRKLARKNGVQEQEYPPSNPKKERPKTRAKKRHREKVIPKDKSRPQNVKVFGGLKVDAKMASAGKQRPSRKKKVVFKSKPMVVHLKGSRFSGGYRLF